MEITRQKLWKAAPAALVRLAKALGLRGCACGRPECRADLVEKVARVLA
jgi:hypothetical protein